MAFDPDKFLAKHERGQAQGFDPDAFLAQQAKGELGQIGGGGVPVPGRDMPEGTGIGDVLSAIPAGMQLLGKVTDPIAGYFLQKRAEQEAPGGWLLSTKRPVEEAGAMEFAPEATKIREQLAAKAPVAAQIGDIGEDILAYSLLSPAMGALGGKIGGATGATQALGKAAPAIGRLLQTAGTTTALAQAEDFAPENIPEQLALGAGGEAVGMGIGKALSPLQKLLEKGGKKVGTRLYESVLKRPKQVVKAEQKQGQLLGEQLYERGIKGSAKSLERQAKKGLKKEGQKLKTLLENIDETQVDPEDIVSELRPLKERFQRPGMDEVRKMARIQDEIDDILTYPKGLSPSEANKVKQEIYKDIPKAWDKDFNAFNESIQKAKARGFRKAVEKAAGSRGQEVKDINKELAVFSKLKDAMEGQQALGAKRGFFSPVDIITGSLLGGGAYLGSPSEDQAMRTIPAIAAFMAGRSPKVKTGMAQGIRSLINTIGKAPQAIGPLTGILGSEQ